MHLQENNAVKSYKGYLIDLDGTMYRGSEPIAAARTFVQALYEQNIPYVFLTNNSTSTPEKVAKKLNSLGIQAEPENVFTSSLATAKYIKHQKAGARCFVVGEEGLHAALEAEGLTIDTDGVCDYVISGLDRNITYEKLAKACLAVRNGATFIATNSDRAIPTERGFLPGSGALTSVISVSTGQDPFFIGKPESIIMQEALSVLGTPKEETLMVGDNYQTDILAGLRADVDTLMVFTGVTPFSDYEGLAEKPTYHVQSLEEWIPHIK